MTNKGQRKPKFRGVNDYKVKHFKNRVRQRFGLALSNRDVIKIARMIRNGESEHVKTKSNTKTRHLIEYKGKRMIVGYDKKHKIPVTAITVKEHEYEQITGKEAT